MGRGRHFQALIAVCVLGFAAVANGQIAGASVLLANADGRNDAYSGIGRLRGPATCTAFWIRSGTTEPAANSPAYVMTAGHCYNLAPNRVFLDQPLTGTVTFRYFADTQAQQYTVKLKRLAYSTMKGHDVAVMELDATYGSLVEARLRPLRISDSPIAAGDEALTVGAPVTGVPTDEAFLRRAECTVDSAADLIEYVWHFWDTYRNRCSDILGGSSGSPMLSRRAGEVVAVVNTSTAGATHETGDFPCYNGQPCEVRGDGFEYLRDTNYAIRVGGAGRCFDSAGRFDVNAPGCPFDPGRELVPATRSYTAQGGTWGVALAGDYAYYRYKTFAEGTGDCRDARNYGAPIRMSESNRIDDALPERDGRYHLCILAGNTPVPDPSWQQPAFATLVHLRVDHTAPTIPIPYTFHDEGGLYWFEPIFVLPELSAYRYKVLSAPGASCNDASDYRDYRRIPIQIAKSELIEGVCMIGYDNANNATAPLELRLKGAQVFPGEVRNGAALKAGESGTIARGSWMTMFGVNLEGASVLVTDSAGASRTLRPSYAGRNQINVLVPEDVAPGAASVRISAPAGACFAALTVVDSAPGIFTAESSGYGAPVGSMLRAQGGGTVREERLFDCSAGGCTIAALNAPAQGEESLLRFYTTGLGDRATAADAVVTLGGQILEVVSVRRSEDMAGIEEITARVPADFRLRGYLELQVQTAAGSSNIGYLRIRATPM